jgi:pyruvate, water dikinase
VAAIETPQERFASPFEVEPPPGAEDWQRLYPYYYLFSEARRGFEEGKFWFFDGMHNPEPIYPFDAIMTESWWVALNMFTTRFYVIPPALGMDQRVVNGYLYISPNSISDPDVIAERAKLFRERAGHYYGNWNEIYDNWIAKAEDCIRRLKALELRDLPEVEPAEKVFAHTGVGASFELLANYNRLIENMQEMACYHFEMLGLGYAAYLTFREFCQKAFPGISDQTIAKMVAGIDILFFRPDDEVRKLARLAIELGLADALKSAPDPSRALAAIAASPRGEEWMEAFETAKDPWFWFSTGPGYSHEHRAWMDDLRLPFNAMRGYVEKLEAGESIERPLEAVRAESEHVFAEYGELLGSDDERSAFAEMRELAKTVYPFVENHNFYVEHWHHSIFWNRVREIGAILQRHEFLEDAEDIFYLHRFELSDALYDLCTGWATSTPARGPTYWPDEVRERKRIMALLREWSPPPGLGVAPDVVTEPFTVMLFGVTTDTVRQWLGQGDVDGELRGIAASKGIVEGPARVITSVAELEDVQTGEVLVCPITAPSWAPVFARIQAAVSDIGGIMSHAAIVSREYGLPAVVGTGFGTKRIRTGQRVRVDGDQGVVTILD